MTIQASCYIRRAVAFMRAARRLLREQQRSPAARHMAVAYADMLLDQQAKRALMQAAAYIDGPGLPAAYVYALRAFARLSEMARPAVGAQPMEVM